MRASRSTGTADTCLVQDMPDVGEHRELELALHLADHELFVQALCSREDEKPSSTGTEKLAGETREPTLL